MQTKQYYGDVHAQYTLQIATPLAAGICIWLSWYFLAILPNWMLWTLTGILILAALLLSTLIYPMWFCTLRYTVSDTHITKTCGIFFVREQSMRTDALQFSSIIRTPRSDRTGLNFIPLHAYGGTVFLLFLRLEDALEIQKFLQETVYGKRQNTQ